MIMSYTYNLRGFLDRSGRLILYPSQNDKKLIALRYLIAKFENGRDYSEKEVNSILNQWHTFKDPALLRRELFDRQFFYREPAVSTYRKRYLAVLPESWETEQLTLHNATEHDAIDLQRIFNACANVGALDPTFQEYPLEEFTGLIARSNGATEKPTDIFRLQIIRQRETGNSIGYYHCYYRVPQPDGALISMFVLHPDAQSKKFGTECVAAITNTMKELLDYRTIRLNVYLRNWQALQFWINAGFTRIVEYRGPKAYSADAHASVILEKTLE